MKINLSQFSMMFFCTLTISLHAAAPVCQPQDFLKDGIDMNAYQSCKVKINTCPMNGAIRQKACVNEMVNKTSNCAQFKKIAEMLEWDIFSALDVNKVANYYLVTKYFTADGQQQDYIVSKNGCLLDTNVDPRSLDNELAEKYKNITFITVNMDKPIYKANVNGTTSFFAKLKTTETCLACKLIGVSTVEFDFSASGQFLKTKLVKFDTTMPKNFRAGPDIK